MNTRNNILWQKIVAITISVLMCVSMTNLSVYAEGQSDADENNVPNIYSDQDYSVDLLARARLENEQAKECGDVSVKLVLHEDSEDYSMKDSEQEEEWGKEETLLEDSDYYVSNGVLSIKKDKIEEIYDNYGGWRDVLISYKYFGSSKDELGTQEIRVRPSIPWLWSESEYIAEDEILVSDKGVPSSWIKGKNIIATIYNSDYPSGGEVEISLESITSSNENVVRPEKYNDKWGLIGVNAGEAELSYNYSYGEGKKITNKEHCYVNAYIVDGDEKEIKLLPGDVKSFHPKFDVFTEDGVKTFDETTKYEYKVNTRIDNNSVSGNMSGSISDYIDVTVNGSKVTVKAKADAPIEAGGVLSLGIELLSTNQYMKDEHIGYCYVEISNEYYDLIDNDSGKNLDEVAGTDTITINTKLIKHYLDPDSNERMTVLINSDPLIKDDWDEGEIISNRDGKCTFTFSNYGETSKNSIWRRSIPLSIYIKDGNDETEMQKKVVLKHTPSTKDISSCTVEGIGDQQYEDKAVYMPISVYDGDAKLELYEDYTISYSNNEKQGEAKVVIKGIRGYTGTVEKSFKITGNSTEKAEIGNLPKEEDLKPGVPIQLKPTCSGAGTDDIVYKINSCYGFKFENKTFGDEGTKIIRTATDYSSFKISAYERSSNKIIASKFISYSYEDAMDYYVRCPDDRAFLDEDYVYDPKVDTEKFEVSAKLYEGLYYDSELPGYDTSEWNELDVKKYSVEGSKLTIPKESLKNLYDSGKKELTLRYTVKCNGYAIEHYCDTIKIQTPYILDVIGIGEDYIGVSDGEVPSHFVEVNGEGVIYHPNKMGEEYDEHVSYSITSMESSDPTAVKVERISDRYWAIYGLKPAGKADITVKYNYDGGKNATDICSVWVASNKTKHNNDARFNDAVKVLKDEVKTIRTDFVYLNSDGKYVPYTGGDIDGKTVTTRWTPMFVTPVSDKRGASSSTVLNNKNIAEYIDVISVDSSSCEIRLKDVLPRQIVDGSAERGANIYVYYETFVDGDRLTEGRVKIGDEQSEYYELTDGEGIPLKEINYDKLESDYPATMKVQKVSLGDDGKLKKEVVEGLKFTTECSEEAIYVRAYNSNEDYDFVIDIVHTPRYENYQKISLEQFGVDDIEDQKYTGKDIYVPLKIYYKENDGGKDYDWSLVMGRDINVEYADNKEEGKATVTITGIGDYEGQIVKTFNIVEDSQSGGDNGGGSSGGDSGGSTGGGGGGAVAPAEPEDSNITNSGSQAGGDASTSVDVKDNTTVTEGKTETKVDADLGSKIVEKAVENKSTDVVIKAETEQGSSSASTVALPASTIKEISDKTEASVTIKTDSAEVSLDKAAVAAVAAQAGTEGEVKLVVETKEAKDDQVVVELKIETSNGTVSNFNGGNVTVTVPVSEELASKTLVCVYIDENGVYTKVGGSLSSDKKTFVFTTGHFSTYAILEEAEADAIIAEQDKPAEEVTPVKVGKPAVKLYAYKGGKLRVKANAKNAIGYKVYYKKSNWKKYKTYTKGNIKTLDKTFKKLSKGKYTVKVKAYNKAADGKLIVGAASKAKTITVKK